MEEILKQLQIRFPLLTRLSLEDDLGDFSLTSLPAYLGFFLAAMEHTSSHPICFVLPRTGEIARLSSVLYAMHQLIRKQSQLTEGYAERNFKIGDLICVHPGRHVFKYGGYDPSDPERVWFETIDNNGRRQALARDVVNRMEKVSRQIPIGKLNTPILSPTPTPLDALLGTSFFGNHSFVQNELLILDSVGEFDEFAVSCKLRTTQSVSVQGSVRTLMPLGYVVLPSSAHRGWLKKSNDIGSTSDPLIALTHSPELLANYCIEAASQSKLVVVNGLERLRNLQTYDDISQTQRLVLFAEYSDEELIEALGNRGCRFWPLSARELGTDGNGRTANALLVGVTRCARNFDALYFDEEPCEDALIDDIWLKLKQLRKTELGSDGGAPIRIISVAWRLFRHAYNLWDKPPASDQERSLGYIRELERNVHLNQTWISPEEANVLKEIIVCLSKCCTNESSLGIAKGQAILRVVDMSIDARESFAVVVRDEALIQPLQQWLSARRPGLNAEIYSPRALHSEKGFDHVIYVSWPGAEIMQQMVAKLAAPHFTMVGYPCERHWLRQCQPRFKPRIKGTLLSPEEKVNLVMGDSRANVHWPTDAPIEPIHIEPVIGSDIWDLERRLRSSRIGLAALPTEATETFPARYIRFSGDCYAFLTEGHKLAIATDIVSGRGRPGQALPERGVIDIKAGDFVVFPESGARELVQELADKLIGPTAENLRAVAHLWKEALQTSSLTPGEFLRQSISLNRPRHIATIRNWFAETAQIGPRDKDDLILIALITGNQSLERQADDVRAAIERLWGAHLSAGTRLRDALLKRLPQVMGQVEENGTKVDLGELGSAWIVKVEFVAEDTEPRGHTEINRLLFEVSAFSKIGMP